jgi:hypothetical protein
MLILVIVVGVAVLVFLAVAVGRIEGGSQEAAWRNIARQRRDLAERSRLLDERAEALVVKEHDLWEWEAQLVATAYSGGCPVCELRRSRGERPAS